MLRDWLAFIKPKLNQWDTETISIEQIPFLDKGDLVYLIIEKYGIKEGAVIGNRLPDINAAKVNCLTAAGVRYPGSFFVFKTPE